jgi:uracil-DNA glycosylase family 4
MKTPDRNCNLCPRLCEFRHSNREKFPSQWNAPVPSFGPITAELLIVGLAPGLKGANFTGRPFTADYAGDLLYGTLLKFGFATGDYQKHAGDGLTLHNCRITNAVRCVPPENKPTPDEMKTCLEFLKAEINAMPHLKIILTLGSISHQSSLKALDEKASAFKFAHLAQHQTARPITLINSYHCSRYNTQTKRLSGPMFHQVFAEIKTKLDRQANEGA